MVGTARLRTEKVKVALNTISLQVRVTSTWERTEVGEGKMGWGRREVGSQRVAGVRGGGRGLGRTVQKSTIQRRLYQ